MKFPYYLSALLAFLIWGTFSLVLRPLKGYPAIDILLFRIGIASTVSLLISLVARSKITKANIQRFQQLTGKDKRKLAMNVVVSAVMLSFNWYMFIYVMNNVSINATALAYLICPILTTVLASFFLNEQLNRGQWIAVGLSFFSCLLLSYGHFIDTIYSVMIALSYAIYLILQKQVKGFDKFFVLSIQFILCLIMLTPLIPMMPEGITFEFDFYMYVAVIAVVFTIIPLFLNGFALKGLDSSVVGVLLYLNPILGFLIAIFYFNEEVNALQLLAYGLIFLAVLLFNIAYLGALRKQRRLDVQV